MPPLRATLTAVVAALAIAGLAALVVFPDPTGTLPLLATAVGTPLLALLFLATGFEHALSLALVFCVLLFALGLGLTGLFGVLQALDVYTLPAATLVNPVAVVLVVLCAGASYGLVSRRGYTPMA